MNYYFLGKLPQHVIDFYLEEIYKRRDPTRWYQWVQFDDYLHNEFMKMFTNTDLEVSFDPNSKTWIQKAFFSQPGHGFRIHKDGVRCKTALNIALQCNDDDWVRWYDEAYINALSETQLKLNSGVESGTRVGESRNVNIEDYENIEYIEQRKTSPGDVYLVNTDVFHSFKCNGEKDRVIIQTKFKGYPDIKTVKASLDKSSFNCLIR